MRDVFLADAHLLDPADANYRRLLSFLDGLRGETRTLYLLGDIFEFWIGYRHAVFAPYVPLLEALRRLREAGTALVYVEGNHDFHMGPYFEQTLGCRVLADGGVVEIDSRRVFIAHGDLVNPADRGYRRLRRFLRSRPLRLLAAILPPDQAWEIARWASRQSRKGHAAKRARWVPETLLAAHAERRFAEGCDAVVTGHFHAPLLREEGGRTLVALGDWIDQYSYAVLEDGTFSLHALP
jgi:UDP-2,3-diacylglucosamine hydrolase